MAINALEEIRLKVLVFSNFVAFTLFMFPSLENSHFCGHTFGKVWAAPYLAVVLSCRQQNFAEAVIRRLTNNS
jgi:hypothetical protein